MGIKSSFITNYCMQVKFQFSEENLLSYGFQKVENNQSSYFQASEKQLYQHYRSNKLYILQHLKCPKKEAAILSKALQSLQMIKNDHICNVLFSSIDMKTFNIIHRQSEIKIFTQFSSVNLVNLMEQKSRQKSELQNLLNQQQNILPYTNTQIANFIHTISSITGEIELMCLPIEIVDPEQFLVIHNQGGRIKYNINFDQIVNQNIKNGQNGYFSQEIWKNVNNNSTYFELNSAKWQQKYQKNLIFAFGMLILHYLLLQPSDDCYNYRSKQFCKSQLQNKLLKLSKLLEKRIKKTQQSKRDAKEASDMLYSGTYIDRLHTEQKTIDQEEPFQFILYETIVGMVFQNTIQRISISQLKKRSKKLMQKVREEITLTKSLSRSENTFTTNIHKAKHTVPLIKSISNNSQLHSFDEPSIKKSISAQENDNHTALALRSSKSKSMITLLKSKRVSDKEKSMISINDESMMSNKENIDDNRIESSNLRELKSNIRKLSGYKKVKISEHSYMQGYFQNDKAHGLGKITRKNGQIIECIFHNNQIIQQILPTIN